MAADASAAHSAPRAAPYALVPFHDIYEHLEGARQKHTSEDLQQLLEQRLPQLRSCGDLCKPRAPSLRDTFMKKTQVEWHGHKLEVDALQRDLCVAISDRLDIDEVEALGMLRTFLDSEHRSVDALERTLTFSSEGFDDFLDAFYVFYFEEQLALIRCTSALLRIAEDARNELFSTAMAVLDQMEDADLARGCLQRFEEEMSKALPSSVAGDTHYASLWARHGLERQLALLEVAFLLYYGRLSPSAAFLADILECGHRTQFGQRQANASLFDTDAHAKCRCIRDLLLFLAIECLNLEAALDVVPEGIAAPDDAALAPSATDPDALERCLVQLEKAASDVAYAPLLLSFALVLRRLDEVGSHTPLEPRLAATLDVVDHGPQIWRRLLQGAFDPSMQLFDTMHSLVTSPLLRTATRALGASNLSALAYRAVFKGLLLTITELVQPEYLPDLDPLVDLWCLTFRAMPGDVPDGIAALCTQFWTQDIQYPTRASLLDTVRRRFPASFLPLVRLAHALSGTAPDAPSPDTVAAMMNALAHVSSVALILPQRTAGLGLWETLDEAGAPSVTYRLQADMPVAHTQMHVPAGTHGVLISPSGQAPAIVLWQLATPISAWHILHDAFVSSVVPSSSAPDPASLESDSPTLLSPDWENDSGSVGVIVAELFADVLQTEEALGEALLAHLGEQEALVPAAVALVQAGLASQPLDTRRVYAGYRLLMALLPLRPNDIWQHVRSTNVLIGSPGHVPLLDASVPRSALLTHERRTGVFTGTFCLLDLLYALLEHIQSTQFVDPPSLVQVQASVLARAIGWAGYHIWPDHQQWHYADNPSGWMHLSFKCLRLFSAVLSDPCFLAPLTAKDPPAAVLAVQPLHLAVEHVLGHDASSATFAPMLHALGVGHARIDALYRAGDTQYAHVLEELMALCLETSSLLVARPDTSHVLTALLVGAAPGGGETLASVIFAYIAAPVSPSLATAAAHLLTDMVRAPDMAALRLAGHLGSTKQVEDAVDQLLGVLENTAADAPLRIALWHMLSAFVSNQPALATLLLTGAHLAHDLSQHSSSKPRALHMTALDLAVQALRTVDELWDANPQLLDAVLYFLNEAWAQAAAHPQVFGELRTQSALWDGLVELIRRPVPVPPALDVEADESATLYASRLLCQAHALGLLPCDLSAMRAPRAQPTDRAGCVRVMLALCSDASALQRTLHDAMLTMPAAVPMTTEKHLCETAPDVPWALLRHKPQRHDYERERAFGPSYMYDLPTVLRRTRPDPLLASSQQATRSDVLHCVAQVSLRWSVVDAQARRAVAWTDCLGIMTAHLLAQAEAQGAASLEALQRSLSEAALHIGPLALEQDRPHVVTLLAVLIGASHVRLDAAALEKLSTLVAKLGESSAYKLPAFTSQGVRSPLVQLMLAVASCARRHKAALPALPTMVGQAMDVFLRLESLAPLLEKPLSESARQAERDLDTLVAFLHKCMAPEAHVPASTWLGPIRETRMLPICAELLSSMPLTPEHDGVGAPRTHMRFFMPLLRFLEALASHSSACELVAHAGVVRALCATALSSTLEQGGLDAVQPSGEPHPLHAAWLLMLRIVVRLVENLGLEDARGHLVDADVQVFVYMYAAQLRRSLTFSPLTQTNPLDVGQLQEVAMVLRLFRSMWTAKAPCQTVSGASPHQRAAMMPLGEPFLQDTPLLLQQLAYLRGHADELSTMLGFDASTPPTAPVLQHAHETVAESLVMLLTLMWDMSGADVIMTCDPHDWPMLPALIHPSMHVASHAPASFGTLLELASTLTKQVQRKESGAAEALEQCIGLCATQAMAWAQGPMPRQGSESISIHVDQAQAELDAGLGRDIEAAIQSASEADASAWWKALSAFHARYMQSRV